MPGLEEEPRIAPQEQMKETENRAPLEVQEAAEQAVEKNREEEPELDQSVRFEDLPKAEQERLLPEALARMSKVLEGIEDYAVFASTAMYLNGEILEEQGDKAGAELKTPPGDFDAAVFSEESLQKIRDRMAAPQEGGASFEFAKVENGEPVYDEHGEQVYEKTPSEFMPIKGEDVKKLAGKFVFDAEVSTGAKDEAGNDIKEKRPVKYDYEFFLKSKVVSPELAQGKTINREGLHILDLEGLQEQYQKNLELEGGIEERVGEVVTEVEALKSSDFRSELMDWNGTDPLSETTNHVLKNLDVDPADMKKVFEIQTRIDDIDEGKEKAKRKVRDLQKLQMQYRELGVPEKVTAAREEIGQIDAESQAEEDEKRKLISERATLLTGTKTKLWKRELNVLQLARIRSGERPLEFKRVIPENASLGENPKEVIPANRPITEEDFPAREAA